MSTMTCSSLGCTTQHQKARHGVLTRVSEAVSNEIAVSDGIN